MIVAKMQRAAISIPSNIAEGFERGGDRELRQFLAIAKGSAGELRSQLYIALDAGLIDEAEFEQLLTATQRASRLIAAFMAYLSRSPQRGSKFNLPTPLST